MAFPVRVPYRDLLRAAIRSRLAYMSPADLKKQLAETQARDPVFVTSPAETKEDAQAYVWTEGRDAYVTFRGTSSFADALADADVAAVPMRGLDGVPVPGVLVHRGFYEQFLSVEPQIADQLQDQLRTSCGPAARVQFEGHSLGSGVAQIAAAYFGGRPSVDVYCLTFGGPRAGNAAFARWFADRCTCVRVVNSNDPVPMIPQRRRWVHTGPTCLLIDDACAVRVQDRDVPWWRRLLYTARNIDFCGLIKDHDCDIYIERLERLAKEESGP